MPNDMAESSVPAGIVHYEPGESTSAERIVEFYSRAGMDYEHWSSGFNMHLGYYHLAVNPLDREQQLEEMNFEIARRLGLGSHDSAILLDLGCGMGAIARTVATIYPYAI